MEQGRKITYLDYDSMFPGPPKVQEMAPTQALEADDCRYSFSTTDSSKAFWGCKSALLGLRLRESGEGDCQPPQSSFTDWQTRSSGHRIEMLNNC